MRVALVLVVLLIAGCAQPTTGTGRGKDAPGAVFVDPIDEKHDHAIAADHNRSTASMSLVGFTPMGPDGKPYSYVGEMDTFGNLTVVQVLGRGSVPGFVVLDVADPTHPTPIGRAEMPSSYVVDVKWAPDGKSLFAASQANPPATVDPTGTAYLQSAGFTQFDMKDPTKPKAFAGGFAPGGCHMLSVKKLAGETFVFCVAQSILVFSYSQAGAWAQRGAIGPGASGAGLTQVATDAPGFSAAGEPHDITIQEDPKQPGRWIATISYWDFGVRFYDVTDPAQPKELGAWSGEGAKRYEGNVHSAMLTLHEGKRMAVVDPELLGNNVPAIYVLDVDDLSHPKLASEWLPPGEHGAQSLRLTTHQFQVVDGKVYLAYNHAGVWVLDLDSIVHGEAMKDPARPEVLGYYLPHQNVTVFDAKTALVPDTWDVNVVGGNIFASDRYTGFYVLKLAGDAPTLVSGA